MNSRNKVLLMGMSAILTIFSATACGKEANVENVAIDTSKAAISSEKVEENIEYSGNVPNNYVLIDGKKYEIVGSSNADAALKENYNTVTELLNSDTVSSVVKGTVKDVTYDYLEHCPFTIFTLEVQECYKGNVDNTITIYEDGGYIPYTKLTEDFRGHEEEGQNASLEDCAMDMRFMNAEHIETGDTIIGFLESTSSPMIEGSYQFVSSVYGRFILEDGEYSRTNIDVNDEDARRKVKGNGESLFETTLSENEMEDVLSK